MMLESLVRALAKHWWVILLLPFWLLRGRAYFKHRLATMTSLDPALLPYREDLLEWLRSERKRGRFIVLATGSNETIAARINEHLRLFDEVMATGLEQNLTGHAKARALAERFGAGQFDYAGNSSADEPAWRKSRLRIVAGAAGRRGEFDREFPERTSPVKAMLRALRPKHWVKNILVFVPLLSSHRFLNGGLIARAVLTFAAFCLIASTVYIVNDLLDLDSDRRHPVKHKRPFASGDLSIRAGFVAAPLLFAAGLGIAATLGAGVLAVLGFYFALTLVYSFHLKRKLLVDVFALAILYTLRIIAGAESTGISCSVWLLAFSVFQFLSLAFLKRSAELARLLMQSQTETAGRGYFSWDLAQINIFGIAAGYMSSLVLGMYIGGEQVRLLYRQPSWLWIIVVVQLYWMTRVWILSHRGAMNEDPILFAASDRVTWICMAICTTALFTATAGSFALPGVSQ